MKKIAIAATISHSGFRSPWRDAEVAVSADSRTTAPAATAAGGVCAVEKALEWWSAGSEFIMDLP
jgi:hypothetical protein